MYIQFYINKYSKYSKYIYIYIYIYIYYALIQTKGGAKTFI